MNVRMIVRVEWTWRKAEEDCGISIGPCVRHRDYDNALCIYDRHSGH